ncbi:NAD-dependent epimerase/dehydratase family protein [Pseudarthrobacter sp. NBSH8]|uniref:NAD-dependent epimerase/dehydratase family protein n=1 Tax=Pseudarthrobacter sp. NBSH8 TaxID=2596911 RepID=UPI001629D736|nr:NAD-dependent epimerase/dehydratase family protein [Pseudarthrobacter sp. NBSH8]QNE15164.1 NAD-dependent epimerase/dehydratase family protein [Pseudarthrobacter sp. NBSH8]
MQARPTWVIGAGGLLGRAVVRELESRKTPVLTSKISWADPEAALREFRFGAEKLRNAAASGQWTIAWCAGAGVTGTSQAALDAELSLFSRALGVFEETLCADGDGRMGAMFLASSAGGVYAGSSTPPFTEESPVQPLAPYGFAKLKAEAAVTDFAKRTAVRTLIGRVSNLYGPGQNLRKPQGLISVFAKAHLTGAPVSVYVSLDTLRDYLFVDDASRLVSDGIDRLVLPDVLPGETIVKILASQRADTIGNLIGACRAIFKRRPLIILGASPFAKAQAHDLRLRSVVWPELDEHPVTPLAVGINYTVQEVQRLAVSGKL